MPTWLPLDVTGSANYNSAGSGGDGVASSNPMAVMPSNAAIAGPNSAANAHQSNNALINQHATEVAGMGGDGGIGTLQLAAETPLITLAVAAMGFSMVVW